MGSKTRAAGRRFREGDFHLPSPDEIEAAKTPAGAWAAMQLAEWGVKWPPKAGWRRNLEARWNALHPRPTITCKDGGWFGLWLSSGDPSIFEVAMDDAGRYANEPIEPSPPWEG